MNKTIENQDLTDDVNLTIQNVLNTIRVLKKQFNQKLLMIENELNSLQFGDVCNDSVDGNDIGKNNQYMNVASGFASIRNSAVPALDIPAVFFVDYSIRPEKDLSDMENVIYCYESEIGVDVDVDDLANVLMNFETDDDREHFQTILYKITSGIKQMFSSRNPGIHAQTLRILDHSVEIRYNKVSEFIENTSFNKF
jgi:hypothetical protein